MEDVKRAFAAKVKCPVYDGYVYGHIPVSHAIDFRRMVRVSADGTMNWEIAKYAAWRMPSESR